jgi:hypothetical protein
MSIIKPNPDNIRHIQKTRNTYSVSIPANIARKLGWHKRQKVVVSEKRGRLTIKDWQK